MPKLIKKYQDAGTISFAPNSYAAIQNLIANQNFASTTSIPQQSAVQSLGNISTADILKNAGINIDENPTIPIGLDSSKFNAESVISGLPGKLKPIDTPPVGGNSNNVGGFNFKNQAMGMAANYIGQAIGQQVGGKYGNEIGQLGSIVGQQLLTNGNLKGLFSGASGNALGGIGYGILNKAMGGDKNKDFGSRMLTDLGGMAWSLGPVAGAAVTGAMVLNNLTGKKTHKFEGNSWQSQEMQADLGGSYGSSIATINNAKGREGQMGGLGRITGELSRSNRRIDEANRMLADMDTIYDEKQLGQIRGQKMADINSLDYRLNTFGGYNQYGTVIGRKGMKLPTGNDINRVRDLLKLKKGGQMNVIPEGALHARLHHMETGNKITRKGIPVIDKNGEQQAEIERNEIIFSLEVTNKLEELRKDGSDKAALEAGKLLVDEIFHNTDDRTGLIQEVIGTDEAKKGIFKEGGIIAERPNFAIQAEEPEIEKFQDGGIIAEEPEMDSDEDEPVGIEEVEYFQTGGIIAEEPDGSDDEEVEEYQEGKKIKYPHWDESMMPLKKPKFEEWIKDVNPDFNSPNYDLEAAYEIYPFEQLERWKWATRQPDPNYYLNYQDENGNYIYHLNSIAEMPNGEYMFLKKGTERTNPEIEGELAAYYNGENGLLDTHDLKFDYKTNRYYYRHKQKHQEGGIVEQLNKLSPDKLKELENILKYLSHD